MIPYNPDNIKGERSLYASVNKGYPLKMFMLVLVFLGLAAAAPHYSHHHHHHGYDRFSDMGDFHPSFGRELFDPNRFWADFEAEFRQLDDMMREFHLRFPGAQSTAGVDGDQYKVTIPLSGFDEKDIVVKARVGVLMVQATQKSDDGIGKNYLDVRTMPEYVNAAGVWTYENDLLTIAFPLNRKSTTLPTTTVTRGEVERVTEDPSYSSEEIINITENIDDTQDADVGVKRNEFTNDHAVQTNEISKVPVEATTYAVDLKNQYEFVPVHYKK